MIGQSCSHDVKPTDGKVADGPLMIADSVDATNDFYDNADTYALEANAIEVLGEIKNPGAVDFSTLPLRSVIVKETLFSKYGNLFSGAFRYDGYSLHDILNERVLNKKNQEVFKPIVDLYIEIENDKGEKVVISWGEIYYANHPHDIMIATQVTRVIPSKSKMLWELPLEYKVIVPSDILTERNISNPTKITVKSYDIDRLVEKGKTPLFSPTIDLYIEDKKIETIAENPASIPEQSVHTIFYGRGRGLHSTDPFTGMSLKKYFNEKVEKSKKALREGLFVFTADDGYRGVFSYSEICNRNDQMDVLLICRPDLKDGGVFRLYTGTDFFSDRAIKGLNAICYSTNQRSYTNAK